MLKCFASCDVVNEECPDRTTVIRPSYGSKILLPGGVPDLQLDGFSIYFQVLGRKLHADSHIVIVIHFLFDELKHDARFPDP